MLPALLARWFGPNWKTSTCGFILLIAGFISATPQLVAHWPVVVEVARYFALGSGAAALKLAADAKPEKP